MDIVRIKGGLGNQMFQYAFVEALRDHGREVGCSLGFYRKHPDYMPFVLKDVFPLVSLNEIEDDVFNEIDLRWIEIKKDKKRLADFKRNVQNRFFWVEEFPEECFRYLESVFETNNCTFVGYWQTEKYFKNIERKIRRVYTFENVNKKLLRVVDRIKNNYYGVHIRRGDYLKSNYLNICTKEYYINAMEYVISRNENAKFIFFSDDIEWVYQNLYVEGSIYDIRSEFEEYRDWYDMYLMSQCRGNIISNSTFGWWGAWLNQNPDKIVIAPRIWMTTDSTPDIWCDSWIRM